ncbi:MAG: GAF domain-containing protein [Janthinobacterium lividum]
MATTPFLGRRPSGTPLQEHSTALIDRPRRARTASGAASFAVTSYRSTLLAESDPQARLQRGVDLLALLVDGCHHASIAAVAGGRVRVSVATDRISRRAAELQDELGEGPSLQAVRTGHSVVVQDLDAESRWLAWCSAVGTELPVTTVLSVLLVGVHQPKAVLNVCSDTVGGLSAADIALVHTLAAPLADTLLDARADDDLLGPAA